MTNNWKAVEQYFTVVILENVSILEWALSGVKGLNKKQAHERKTDIALNTNALTVVIVSQNWLRYNRAIWFPSWNDRNVSVVTK